jgi:Glycosyl transferases group 1
MNVFFAQVNDRPDAPPVPPALREAAEAALAAADTVEKATDAFERFLPELSRHAPDADLFIACGMMMEKQRRSDGMLMIWSDIAALFPRAPLALRMMMRWFRRHNQVDEGLTRLHQIVPNCNEPEDVRLRMLGYMELSAVAELDTLMAVALKKFSGNRSLRIKYIEALAKQNRMQDAAVIARSVRDYQGLDKATRELLEYCRVQSTLLDKHMITDASSVLGRIVETFVNRQPAPVNGNAIGRFAFFTGQLGAGGAERQMSRLATLYQKAWTHKAGRVGRFQLLAPPAVCVRHATSASRSDFFLPMLLEAAVETTVLTDLKDPVDAMLEIGPACPQELLQLMPADILASTRKLVPYFRKGNFETVYLWQDGGVLAAALAALVAGVPRIVTSFRGLPPNLRPELMRPQMPALYRALAKLPGVRFSSNSVATARAYEAWLNLPAGFIRVVHNAVPVPSARGDAADHDVWKMIEAASPDCTQTVIGIFRFDQNKRPEFWIRTAKMLLETRPDVRFVILGAGNEYQRCLQICDELNLQRRLFMPGTTRHVGFYLARADLLMHLAQMEGLPNVLIEAQLAGVPVIATPAGGTAEVVSDGVTGHLLSDAINPTVEEVSSSLEALLADPALLRQMGELARKQSGDRFVVDSVLEATLSLFVDNPLSAKPT